MFVEEFLLFNVMNILMSLSDSPDLGYYSDFENIPVSNAALIRSGKDSTLYSEKFTSSRYGFQLLSEPILISYL